MSAAAAFGAVSVARMEAASVAFSSELEMKFVTILMSTRVRATPPLLASTRALIKMVAGLTPRADAMEERISADSGATLEAFTRAMETDTSTRLFTTAEDPAPPPAFEFVGTPRPTPSPIMRPVDTTTRAMMLIMRTEQPEPQLPRTSSASRLRPLLAAEAFPALAGGAEAALSPPPPLCHGLACHASSGAVSLAVSAVARASPRVGADAVLAIC